MEWSTIAMGVGALALLAGILYVVFGYYGGKQGFQNPTVGSSRPNAPTFTMCHATWCGHCKNALPDFQKFAANGKVVVNGQEVIVQALEATENAKELKSLPEVKGYPTFVLQTVDGNTVEYRGPRTPDGYLAFLNENLGTKTA